MLQGECSPEITVVKRLPEIVALGGGSFKSFSLCLLLSRVFHK